jgi:hypothetical protein
MIDIDKLTTSDIRALGYLLDPAPAPRSRTDQKLDEAIRLRGLPLRR